MIYTDVIKVMKELEEMHKRYRPEMHEIHNMCVKGNVNGYACVAVMYDGMTLQKLLGMSNDQGMVNEFNSSIHTGWKIHTMAIPKVIGVSECPEDGEIMVLTDEGSFDGNSIVKSPDALASDMAEIIANAVIATVRREHEA